MGDISVASIRCAAAHLDACVHELIQGCQRDRKAVRVCAAALVDMAVVVAHAGKEAHGVLPPHKLATAAVHHRLVHALQHLLLIVVDADQVAERHLSKQTLLSENPLDLKKALSSTIKSISNL